MSAPEGVRRRGRPASVLGPSDWGGDEVLSAQAGLERARRVHAAATDARALAVWRARRRGATLEGLGRLLGGMSRSAVLELERRGAGMAAECDELGCCTPGNGTPA